MKIYVKNMYSQKTIPILQQELERLGINYHSIELGEINFNEEIPLKDIFNLDVSIHKYRLSLILMDSNIVTEIRNTILDLISQNDGSVTSISNHLTTKLGYNYSYLNNWFTIETGLSIERYVIEKSAEKMKSGTMHKLIA